MLLTGIRMPKKRNTRRARVRWSVVEEDGYVKVVHSQRGTICMGVWHNQKVHDITFLDERDRKCNMIRMPAMDALIDWQRRKATKTAETPLTSR